ncbi:Nucleoside-diphosphate-sugar epimerase [Lachnospiraceae bacterium XBB2008]|nr:Nucleoside-diphosphate-sugar epimerase [Lachnospiraceae bacterium XBB2008]
MNTHYLTELNTETERLAPALNRFAHKSILITGASGMIGSYLVDLLMLYNEQHDAGIRVCALSRNLSKLDARFDSWMNSPQSNNLILIEHDVTNEFTGECFPNSIDYIIHAASNTHPLEYSTDPVGTITANSIGTYNIFEYAKRVNESASARCRVIILSSVEIYGENRGDVEAFDESYMGYIDCNTLRAGYPESKRLSEAMMQAYIKQYRIDAVCVRLARIYGPNQEKDDSKALSQFIRNALNRENIVLKSAGTQFFSYIYIADAVRAIIQVLMDGKCGECYNIADSISDSTLKDIASILASYADTNVVFDIPDEQESKGYSTATKAILDSNKIKRDCGWNAYYDINEGLRHTLDILKDIND